MKNLAKTLLSNIGMTDLLRWYRRNNPVVVVYHGVIADENWRDWETSDMVADSVFRGHLEFYQRYYNVVPLSRIAKFVNSGDASLPPYPLAITFDDGFRNNFQYAARTLRLFGLTATFFVTTGFVDRTTDLWWIPVKRSIVEAYHTGQEFHLGKYGEFPARTDAETRWSYYRALALLKKLPRDERSKIIEKSKEPFPDAQKRFGDIYEPLTWDEVRQIAGQGMEIGAHTVTHAILSIESEERARQEVFQSVRRIRDELRIGEIPFSYPNGQRDDFTDTTGKLVQAAGCYAAVAGFGGSNRRLADPYQVGRFPIGGYHTAAAVELDLCGLGSVMRRMLRVGKRVFHIG